MDRPHPSAPAVDDAWRQIDAALEELAALARQAAPPAEFYRGLLDRLVATVGATAAAVWRVDPAQRPELLTERNWLALLPDDVQETHGQLLHAAAQAAGGRVLHAGDLGRSLQEQSWRLILTPWQADDRLRGVLELVLPGGESPRAEQALQEFAAVVAQLVGDYQRRRQVDAAGQQLAAQQQFEQLLRRLHGSLDLSTVVSDIAHEGRWFCRADRVTVLLRRGRTFRVAATSGVDAFNRRSDVLRRLEQLAGAAAVTGDPLWHAGPEPDRPPAIEEALQAYLDVAHSSALAVLPLQVPATDDDAPRPAEEPLPALLVVESFHAPLDDAVRRRVTLLATHAALALRNALTYRAIPLAPVFHALARRRRSATRSRALAWAGGAAAALLGVLLLMLIPADDRVEARGELQPIRLREIFAPDDGIIDQIRTPPDALVAAGDVVVTLRKPDLEFEIQRVAGELQTTHKRLAATEAERLRATADSQTPGRRPQDLTAQEEEYRATARNLEQQRQLLRRQQAQLELQAPIAGRVLTWNVEQLLRGRPVSRGQVLLTVADLSGPWQLNVRIPDRRVAAVLAAREDHGPALPVTFILATDPATHQSGTLDSVGPRAESGESDGNYVPATVRLDHDAIPQRIPGAGVVARIDCGRRSLLYVWLHDLWTTLQTWFWF